nr:hypothetical protein [Nitrosomonas nitrosa]
MLPDDAFLRTIPDITDPATAVHIDAVVFSGDTIFANFNAMRQTGLRFKEHLPRADRLVKVGMFTHAWTIVDCVHVIRQNIRALAYDTPLASQYLTRYESATLLRNKMDHLAQNAQNTARIKKRPPIFGSLTYICIPDDKITEQNGRQVVIGGGMVVLTTGRIADFKQVGTESAAGVELNRQVGRFRLDAFDQQLDLDAAAEDTEAVLLEMDNLIKKQMHEMAEQEAAKLNKSKEDLLKHSGAGLSLYLAFDVKEE